MASSLVLAQVPAFLTRHGRGEAAWDFAQRAHAGQTRPSDGAPFIQHPAEVAMLLDGAGSSELLVVAGVLHDTVERTATMLGDLEDEFGQDVAALVAAVTEDPTIRSYSRRKAALRSQVSAAGGTASELFAADKLSKVWEFRVQLTSSLRGGAAPRSRRLLHYSRSLATLEAVIPAHSLVARLRSELTELETLARSAYRHK